MIVAYPQFFMLLAQLIALAFALPLARAGSSNAARMAIIAMTTSSSIRVNAGLALPIQGTPGDVVWIGVIEYV